MPQAIRIGQYWSFNAEWFYEVIAIRGNWVTLRYLNPLDPFKLTVSKLRLRKEAWLVD